MRSITYYSSGANRFAWAGVAGIANGDSEETILALGDPTNSSIDGVSKTIEYADIGVKFTLIKGRVYMCEMSEPTGGNIDVV